MSQPWFVYIVQCSDTTWYTGVTPNITDRIEKHNKGHGAKYTRSRTPVSLVYQQECLNKSEAQKQEAAIKKLTRKQKEALVSQLS